MDRLVGRLKTRSFDRVFFRIYSIIKRYGFSVKKYNNNLHAFMQICAEYNTTPTFPVTANVLCKHSFIFKKLQKSGAKLAIHGLRHIDYTRIRTKNLSNEFIKAQQIFDMHQIDRGGNRFPYMRRPDHFHNLLASLGFDWDSSHVISWNGLDSTLFPKKLWNNYQRILNTYNPESSDDVAQIPEMQGNLVQIPVSVPDDDILIERLEIRNQSLLFDIWNNILNLTIQRQEMMILQVHPERIEYFDYALKKLLHHAIEKKTIWIASIEEIAVWWRERHQFCKSIEQMHDKYIIKWQISKRGSVLLKKVSENTEKWYWERIDSDYYIEKSSIRPIIGIAENADMQFINLIEAVRERSQKQ